MIKIKLILAIACLLVVGASQLYLRGVNDGLTQSDNEAFNAYTDFAQRMKAEHKKHGVKRS